MEELENSVLPTYIQTDVLVLFCGINPGRISAMKGHYYANPANLFWRGLYEGGLTPRQLRPEEAGTLLEYGYGITDLVARPTRSSADLNQADFTNGAEQFQQLVYTYRPKLICFNGVTAFRQAAGVRGTIRLGLQEELFFGKAEWEGALVFVIPSTSGANAGFSREERLTLFRELGSFLRARGLIPEAYNVSQIGTRDI